jgi:hypothetical protein
MKSKTVFSPLMGLWIFAFVLIGCASGRSEKEQWNALLAENFQGDWDTYLGPSYDSTANKFDSVSVGLNTDPRKVFSVQMQDGTPVLRVSGEHFGGISTKKEFENYHLRLDFKWGAAKYHPKKNDKRDSGLLYHAGGRHGADFGFWMRSQEFQIQEGDCGDYWGVAGGSFEVNATEKDSGKYVYDPKGKLLLFNEKSPNGRRCIKDPDAEKPTGEWNTLDLYCYGDTAVHVVNGTVVMVLYHSAYVDNGNTVPLKKGMIQLQSEGAELFYRNIKIRSIDSFPQGLLN